MSAVPCVSSGGARTLSSAPALERAAGADTEDTVIASIANYTTNLALPRHRSWERALASAVRVSSDNANLSSLSVCLLTKTVFGWKYPGVGTGAGNGSGGGSVSRDGYDSRMCD